MAERGRPAGFQMGAEHRAKIANSQILNRLIGHAEGTVEMTPTQVTAAGMLLKKVMPDLQASQIEASVEATVEEIRRVIIRPDDKNAGGV
jgi:hypothetical protein